MAQIEMKRTHALGADKARGQIELLAAKLSERLGGAWRWQGDRAVCEAKGAKACVFYDAESISIEVELPFMMRPMRKVLEAKIEDYFRRYFA